MSEPEQTIRFQVLGSLRVLAGPGELAVGAVRERILLAMLLLDLGQTITVQRLVDAVWGEEPPRNARNQLQGCVSRLRKQLATAGVDRQIIATTPHGYQLEVESQIVDLFRFRQLRDEARAAAMDGDHEGARERYRSALSLWRGPVLGDIESRVVQRLAAGFEEERAQALEERIELDLALGAARELVAELTELVEQHPYREALHGALMRALYRAGRQTEALAVYRQVRQRLQDELGVDPGEDLQKLHQAILRQDPSLKPLQYTATTEDRPIPRELPADVAGFTGRVDELAELDKLRLVSEGDVIVPGPVVISAIAGAAGVGKTALAVHWAHRIADRFPDGQLYINLRGFDPALSPMEPAEALRGFLDTLGLPPQRVPANLDGQARLFRSFVADKRILIVLDNARDAAQVRPLLPGSSSCLVLITSRNQLAGLVATDGARPLVLDLLNSDEARDLLARRLSRDRLVAEPEATDEIIAHCSGLPLALAIVAARLATHPLSSLGHVAADLRNARTRLDALSDPDPAADLRAAFDVSYRALNPGAARLFRLLGLHPGPEVSVPAAASLAGISSAQVSAPLAELTRTHLLDEPVAGRYRLHDLLRTYAADRASTAEADRPAASRRMLDHYLHTAHAAANLLYPQRTPVVLEAAYPGAVPEDLADPANALAWFARERAVLIGMVVYATTTDAVRQTWQLARTIAEFLQFQGYWQALADTQSIALDAAVRLADPVSQAHAHRALGNISKTIGRYDEAVTQLTRTLDLFHSLDDPAGEGRTQLALADVRDRQGRHREALAHAELGLALLRKADDSVGLAAVLNAVGWLHARLGDYRSALPFCQEALALQRATGNRVGQSETWDSLGYVHHQLGHDRRAIGCYRRAVALAREHGNRLQEAEALTHLGDIQAAIGETGAARETWQRAQTILEQLGHPDLDRVRSKLSQLTHAPR